MSEIRVGWKTLHRFVTELFQKVGMPSRDAEIEADVLLWANLRGVDSHGVLRIPSYIDYVDRGAMKPKPEIRIEKETPAAMLIEADYAFGPVVTVFAMEQVIKKAKGVGIGWAQIRNTLHQGAMGYYTQMASKEGMIGFAIATHPPTMAPHGARAAGLHNAALAIAAPAKRYPPLSLDMATSVAAGGKINLAIDKGVPIPPDWGLDKDGKNTTDPSKVTAYLPAGGPKGSGMALLFECMTGLMVGNPLLEPYLQGKKGADWHVQNSVVAAINISLFTDVEEYKEHADILIDNLKALPKAEGFNEIIVPGEPEERVLQERLQNGIPLPEGTIRGLQPIAKRFGVILPVG